MRRPHAGSKPRTEQTFFRRRHTHGPQVCEKVLDITNHQGGANQNRPEKSHLTPAAMAFTKQTRDNECWRGYRDNATVRTVGGNVNGYSCYGRYYGVR